MKYNKFVVISLFVASLFLNVNTAALAANYSKVTNDAKINQALEMLEETHSQKTLDAVMGKNLSKKTVKIMFYNLATLSPEYAKAHALATSDDYGTVYILIDNRHKTAPAEAIACLIAHEITHQESITSMDEEIQAWTNEAEQWSKFKAMNPDMNYQGELIDRLNKLEKLYSNKLIAYEVKSNPYYSALK